MLYCVQQQRRSNTRTPSPRSHPARVRSYDGRSADIWSCGVVLFVLGAARMPFDDPQLPNLFLAIASAKYTAPDEWSPGLTDLVAQILVPDPRKRADVEAVRRPRHPRLRLLRCCVPCRCDADLRLPRARVRLRPALDFRFVHSASTCAMRAHVFPSPSEFLHLLFRPLPLSSRSKRTLGSRSIILRPCPRTPRTPPRSTWTSRRTGRRRTWWWGSRCCLNRRSSLRST